MGSRLRWTALAVSTAMALAACSPSVSDESPVTTSSAPATTVALAPSSTHGSTACPSPEMNGVFSVDLDGDGRDEVVAVDVTPSGEAALVLCANGERSSQVALASASATIAGFVDLGGDSLVEVLFTYPSEATTVLGAARVTLRGLALTSLGIPVVTDLPDLTAPGPFEGSSFQCLDWDEDGTVELIRLDFRPADGEENVRFALVTLDGLEASEIGMDQYETTYADAVSIWSAPDRCAPDAPPDLEVRFSDTGWARIPLDPAVFDGEEDLVLTAVAASSDRFVAVGLEAPNVLVGELVEPRPFIWWSDDGRAWNASQVDGSSGEVIDVVSLDAGGFAAGGRVGDNAALWFSDDGTRWDLTPLPAAAEGATGVVYSVVEAPGIGVVALGAEVSLPDVVGPREDTDAAVWALGPDGAWQRIESPAFGATGYQPNADGQFNGAILDGTWLPGTGLVAVGYESASNPEIDYPLQAPAVYVSGDGLTWERRTLGVDVAVRSISRTGEQVVVLGHTADGPTADGMILVSSDAATWERAGGELGTDAAFQLVNDVIVGPDGSVIALGSEQSEFEVSGAAAVWASIDLATWTREPHDDTVFGVVGRSPVLSAVGGVFSEGVVVVVGISGESTELPNGGSVCCLYRPTMWMYDPEYDSRR